MNKTTFQFPVFTIKIDFRNMSASGKNVLTSLHGTLTAKMPPRDPSLLWNRVFYKEWVEEFQVFTIKIDFRNMFASGEVRF